MRRQFRFGQLNVFFFLSFFLLKCVRESFEWRRRKTKEDIYEVSGEREREKPDFGLCIQKRFPGLGSARLPLQRANAYAVCDGRRRRRSFHYIRTRMSGSTFSHLSYFCKHSWPSSPTDYCWTLDFVLLWYANAQSDIQLSKGPRLLRLQKTAWVCFVLFFFRDFLRAPGTCNNCTFCFL